MEHIQSVSKRNREILTALWGFVFGILLASLLPIPPLVSLLIIFVALALYILDRNIFILIALTAFAFGILRYDIKDFHELKLAGDIGIVITEPERRDSDTRFVVRTDTGEKVLVTTELFIEVEYGDEVKLLGSAKALKPGGYANYLSKDEIFYTMDRAKIEVLSKDNGNIVVSNLLKIKNSFVERVRVILPEPESSLLSGLIVSGKQALPKEMLDNFKRAGVVHIVVLSGYNIAIIAEFLFLIFGFWGSRRAAGVSLVGVLLFTLMSGAPATVVRGALMVSLLLLGKLMHRQGSAPRVLLFTAVLMLMHNPKILVFDASFQLSFLAVLGLIYGVPLFEKLFASLGCSPMGEAHGRKGNSRQIAFRIQDLVMTTLATQLFVFPYLLYNMGNFSLVFLLSNLLILPVLPFVMLIGFVATLVAFLLPILSWPIAFVSHILLSWILWAAEVLGSLPFASLEVENFPLWISLILYVLIGIFVYKLNKGKNLSGEGLL